ncbi:putative DNA-binding protein [Fusobacterium varium]|nr:putative DNA-binding protein [Fusobacterium varium]
MNKKEFIKLYRSVYGENITVKESLEDIDIFLKTVEQVLKENGKVKFTKRGVFEVIDRKPRNISNPSTREIMTIYPQKTIRFRITKNIAKY